jgi:hypothetical protein
MGESVSKVMVMVLLDCKGVLLVDFMEKGITINAASYCATVEWLREAIKRQCLGLLTTGVLLLHNNTWPHVALQHNNSAALQVENLGTATIQPRSGIE